MKKGGIALALALVTAIVAATTAIAKTDGNAVAQAAVDCRASSIGVAAPLTGPAAFLGQEQLSWALYAVSVFNNQNKTSFKIVQGDTQLSASLARTVGRQLVSNSNVLGVIGPSTSQAVISSAGLFKPAGLAAVSPSATRTDLTGGKFPTFYRVVPHDGVQAPSIARFIKTKLKARNAVVIDSQDDYSTALAAGTTYRLRLNGVKVQRESVAATDTDFSSVVSNIGNDVNVVVFATQTASAAQTLSQQLREQGKKAVVLGTDGAYSPTVFKPRNGYVSSFAPDLRLVAGSKSVIAGYKTFSKNKAFGTFGPPAYMSAWVLMNAMNNACKDGKATRSEVNGLVKRTNVPSILGGTIRFNKKGDVAGAKFYTFKITNGKYTLAG
jgi:branched-chain amino acid transport system substrate-binding protein